MPNKEFKGSSMEESQSRAKAFILNNPVVDWETSTEKIGNSYVTTLTYSDSKTKKKYGNLEEITKEI